MSDWMVLALPLLAVPIVMLFRFVGCGEMLKGSHEDPFTFGLSANPAEVTVAQGQATTAQITVSGSGGYNNDVTLTATPSPGLTLSFSPDKVNPKNGDVASTVTVTASPTAIAGTAGVTIQGKGAAATPAAGAPPNPDITKTFAMTVNIFAAPPAVPDFSLSLTPMSATVPEGADATFTVTITRTGGFSEPIELSTEPEGGVFNPNPAPGASSVLTARTTGAPAGTYMFTVTGTAPSGATRSTTGMLTVT